MPRVLFTPHLQRHLDCPPADAVGTTVREVLENVFRDHPQLQGYILDDQRRLRQHVVIFVDGRTIEDRNNLTDVVSDSSEIYVMQALSGG